MTLIETPTAPQRDDRQRCDAVRAEAGRLHLRLGGEERVVHPLWLLDRSLDPRDAEVTNRQRLFEPDEIPEGLGVAVVEFFDAGAITVGFTDGRRREFRLEQLACWMGDDPEAPPTARAWAIPGTTPSISWADVHRNDDALLDVLGAFHERGWFRITGTPTAPGALIEIAGRFGRVSPTSFGTLFDVRSIPAPDDLAYTAVGLSAHLDQPYRRPTPGLQFLHTLVNDAPGGESTVVDGLAATEELRREHRDWYEILRDLPIEFRYDIGSDVVVTNAPMIETWPDGSLRQFRFSPRLDFAPFADPDVLDAFYAARRWLSEWLNAAEHQAEFKMAPGDVLVVDNHRVLHGRRPFDPTVGHRHLQGCYIDHDGPATMWRLLKRRQAAGNGR